MGIMADLSAVFQYGAPMEKLVHVLRYKSAVFINAHMVMASLVNNCMWFAYGILTSNWFIISPNILFVSLNTFTLALYCVFNPKTHPLPNDFQLPVDAISSVSPNLTPNSSFSEKDLEALPSPVFEAIHSPQES